MMPEIDIVFDGPPAAQSGRFVEVESPSGKSIQFGTWVQRTDGYWVLRFCTITLPVLRDALDCLKFEDREHVFDRLGLTPYQREQ